MKVTLMIVAGMILAVFAPLALALIAAFLLYREVRRT